MVLTVVGGKRCYVVRLPNERRIVVSEAATVPACYCTAGSTTTTPRTTLFLMWKNCGVLSHIHRVLLWLLQYSEVRFSLERIFKKFQLLMSLLILLNRIQLISLMCKKIKTKEEKARYRVTELASLERIEVDRRRVGNEGALLECILAENHRKIELGYGQQ